MFLSTEHDFFRGIEGSIYKKAAIVWTEFLLEVYDFSFLNYTNLEMMRNSFKASYCVKDERNPLTLEKVLLFINELTKELEQLPVHTNPSGPDYNEISLSSKNGTSIIISKALGVANLKANSFITDNFNPLMRIYTNGSIQFRGKVMNTNRNTTHWCSGRAFEHTAFAIIYGKKFKVFKFEVRRDETLYCGNVVPEESSLRPFRPFSALFDDVFQVFVRVYLKDFAGSEEEFHALTAEELKVILASPDLISRNFKEYSSIYIDETESLQSNYRYLGRITAQQISPNYYQESTGVVRLLSAHCRGTVGEDVLQEVNPGDYIVHRPGSPELKILPQHPGFSEFEARVCDINGNHAKDDTTSYRPGQTLPILTRRSPVSIVSSQVGIFNTSPRGGSNQLFTDDHTSGHSSPTNFRF